MKYMLDTNIITYFLKGRYSSIAEHLKHIPSRDIVISVITLAELEFGARKSDNYAESLRKYSLLTDRFEHISFTDKAVGEYGRIRSELTCAGTPVGADDMLIAATALAEGAVLVTHDTKEFIRIAGLKVEDWTEE